MGSSPEGVPALNIQESHLPVNGGADNITAIDQLEF